jgi:hypothetical protein
MWILTGLLGMLRKGLDETSVVSLCKKSEELRQGKDQATLKEFLIFRTTE